MKEIVKYHSPQTITQAFAGVGVEHYKKLERLDLQKPAINGTTTFINKIVNV